MARNQDEQIRKEKDLLKDFNRLCEVKTEKGNQKYSHEAILEELNQKYYWTETYIDKLLKKLIRNERPWQIKASEQKKV